MLVPILECVEPRGRRVPRHFGYQNPNPDHVVAELENDSPRPPNRGQPKASQRAG